MKILNFPRTPTILAIGVLFGCFQMDKMDWNTAMLMILTYYFTKEQTKKGEA